MTPVIRDPIQSLIERIEASHPNQALFQASEIAEWPSAIVKALTASGVLQKADRAESVWCPGCEWQCQRTPEIRLRSTRAGPEAFVVCDEAPNLGRIPLAIHSLAQYGTTLSALCSFLADEFGLGRARRSQAGGAFLIGVARGRHGPRDITLQLGTGQLSLKVGLEETQLVKALLWDGTRLRLDPVLIRRLANRKGIASEARRTRVPDQSRRRQRARRTESRHKAIFEQAKKMRATDGGSWTQIAAAIAQTKLGLGEHGRSLAPESVRRIISMYK